MTIFSCGDATYLANLDNVTSYIPYSKSKDIMQVIFTFGRRKVWRVVLTPSCLGCQKSDELFSKLELAAKLLSLWNLCTKWSQPLNNSVPTTMNIRLLWNSF